MAEPGLIIVPKKSLIQLKNAMDSKPHFDNQTVSKMPPDDVWSGRVENVGVSIVDMVPHPEPVPGQNHEEMNNGDQLRTCEQYYRENGMRLITDRQYAVALQRSLRLYGAAIKCEEENPTKYVIDHSGGGHEDTLTFFNQEETSKLEKISWGRFFTWSEVNFEIANLNEKTSIFRGRGAITLIE